MESWQVILLVFSGLGVFNSLAFIVYLNFPGKSGVQNSILLQILLLAFVLQIIHALLELFSLNLSRFDSNLYLLGSYMQGPAMYLYLKRSLDSDLKIFPVRFFIHFLPYILLGLLSYDFEEPGTLEWLAIYLVGLQYLIYILLGIIPYLQSRRLYKEGNRQFYLVVYLFPVFALLWLNYPLSGITGINYQIPETVLHSGFVYYLLFLLVRSPKANGEKYSFSKIDRDQSLEIYLKVRDEIVRKQYYLDPDITISRLARKVNLAVNGLSQVINQNSGLSFRDFINTFRVEMAKELMPEKVKRGFTISSIALECGFNSISAFNRAFKKSEGITPTQYLKSFSGSAS